MNDLLAVKRLLNAILMTVFALATFLARGQTPNKGASAVIIVQVQGKVEFMPASGNWYPVSPGTTNQPLYAHDHLRTGPNSRVGLLWEQSQVSFGELTEIEVLPPHDPKAEAGFHLFKGVFSFFHRDTPGRIRIITSGGTAGVEGTEFVLSVGETNGVERTTISMIDGKVRFSNDLGSLTLTNREQAIAEPGQAPRRSPGFIANNVLQWAFYYPAVLDLRDLPLTAQEEQALSQSLAAYRAGDLLQALDKYPVGREPGSDAERVYYAALLLSVGEVEKAEAALARLSAGDSSQRSPRLANALRLLIAAVKRESDRAPTKPQLATELLAASYYEQSQAKSGDSLKNALELARQASTTSPDFGFAWERVAELEFSFGHTPAALEALNKSLELSPRNAQALSLKGFLLAGRNNYREAMKWFDRALAADSGLGNAWLGRGLCRIRNGDAVGGQKDLLMAAALEPQRALLRSYLGKAYANEGDPKRAGHELGMAKDLDPADPTAWLYSALLNEQQNHLNEAVRDLEKSLDLNENRRLYRSEMLLDQDRAVRSASLASIYREAGMTDLSLREAASAVTYDYANYSAHLFLANSFDALRDPTRFNLRYETPWFNELLLANLLSPGGVGAISPNISQQEYYRFFEHDRLGLTTTTDVRSDGQYREQASQFGSIGPLSYSSDLDWHRNEGVRPNNELSSVEWYNSVKYQLTPQDSVFTLIKYQDYHSGDNFQYFDPNKKTVTTNFFGVVSTNTAFRKDFDFTEFQDPTIMFAYHREWAPGIHTLGMGGRLVNDQFVSDKDVSSYVFRRHSSTGQVYNVQLTQSDVDYRSQFDTWISELNQIVQTGPNTLVFGGRYQTGEFETQNSLSNVTFFSAFFPKVHTNIVEGMQRWSVYGYDTVEPWRDHLWLTAGLSYDELKYPDNYRQIPITPGQAKTDLLGPKAAVVFTPLPEATLRGAYTRSLGGVSFDESYRLEPPQLAGFSQSYRTIIPESVVGSVSSPTFETIGGALDLKFKTQTYVGLMGEVLNSDVDRKLGVYNFVDPVAVGVPDSTLQRLRYHEWSSGLSFNQLISDQWSFGAAYKFTRSDLDQFIPELRAAHLPNSGRFDEADFHTISLFLLYQHPSGFFGRAEGNWYLQDNLMRTNSPGHSAVTVPLPGDKFWQANFWVGYRLRESRGDISVGVLNAFNNDYTLNPLSVYAELPRERVVAARLRLRF